MKQSVYARNYESLMGTAVARRPGMHSHGAPWEREDVDVWVLALGCTSLSYAQQSMPHKCQWREQLPDDQAILWQEAVSQ